MQIAQSLHTPFRAQFARQADVPAQQPRTQLQQLPDNVLDALTAQRGARCPGPTCCLLLVRDIECRFLHARLGEAGASDLNNSMCLQDRRRGTCTIGGVAILVAAQQCQQGCAALHGACAGQPVPRRLLPLLHGVSSCRLRCSAGSVMTKPSARKLRKAVKIRHCRCAMRPAVQVAASSTSGPPRPRNCPRSLSVITSVPFNAPVYVLHLDAPDGPDNAGAERGAVAAVWIRCRRRRKPGSGTTAPVKVSGCQQGKPVIFMR